MILAPRLEHAFATDFHFDAISASLTLLGREFEWRRGLPSESRVRSFVRDTIHIRRCEPSPPVETDAPLLARLVSGVSGTVLTHVPTATPNAEIVVIDGVRVRTSTLACGSHVINNRIDVRVPVVRPRLTPGFAHVMNDGRQSPLAGATRVYLTSRDADRHVDLWHRTLAALTAAGIMSRAKAASSRTMLPRSDAIVILARDPGVVDVVRRAAEALPPESDAHPSSLFCKAVGVGIAVGVEPVPTPSGHPTSFGESRSAAVASWLHQGMLRGETPDLSGLAAAFLSRGIDPIYPWRNNSTVAKTPPSER